MPGALEQFFATFVFGMRATKVVVGRSAGSLPRLVPGLRRRSWPAYATLTGPRDAARAGRNAASAARAGRASSARPDDVLRAAVLAASAVRSAVVTGSAASTTRAFGAGHAACIRVAAAVDRAGARAARSGGAGRGPHCHRRRQRRRRVATPMAIATTAPRLTAPRRRDPPACRLRPSAASRASAWADGR